VQLLTLHMAFDGPASQRGACRGSKEAAAAEETVAAAAATAQVRLMGTGQPGGPARDAAACRVALELRPREHAAARQAAL